MRQACNLIDKPRQALILSPHARPLSFYSSFEKSACFDFGSFWRYLAGASTQSDRQGADRRHITFGNADAVIAVLPRVLTSTLAPALLITVIAQMVRLLQDYEYFALTAAGLSPLRVVRPMLLLGLIVMILQSLLAFYISPLAMKALRLSSFEGGNRIVLAELQPGAFKDLKPGMTAFTSGQDNDGQFLDLMIYDTTKQKQTVTFLAKKAVITEHNGEPYFILRDGSQHIQDEQSQGQIITFSTYLLPLSQPETTQAKPIVFNRNHMMIHQLLNPSAHGVTNERRINRMQGRGLELISNLAAPFVFMLVGFAVITAGGISRSGYGQRIMVAILLAIIFQIGVIALADIAVEQNSPALIFIWPTSLLAGAFRLYFETK